MAVQIRELGTLRALLLDLFRHTQARALGRAWGADLVMWGKAYARSDGDATVVLASRATRHCSCAR